MALRILYGKEKTDSFRRLEVIALVNTLAKTCYSIIKIQELSLQLQNQLSAPIFHGSDVDTEQVGSVQTVQILNVDVGRLVCCFRDFVHIIYDRTMSNIGIEEEKTYNLDACTPGERVRATVALYMTVLSIVWVVYFFNGGCTR